MAILVACGLSACGGDDQTTATTEDALAAGAGFVALTTTLLGGGDEAARKSLGFGGGVSMSQGKAAVTTACDSGSVTVDEMTGRTEYDSCATQYTSGSYVLITTLDGVERSVETGCHDGFECSDDASYFLDQYGEGGEPLVAISEDSNGVDLRSTTLLTDRHSVTTGAGSTTYRSLLDGTVTSRDRAAGLPELRYDYDQVTFVETEDAEGYALSIDGAFSTNAGDLVSGCAHGEAAFDTTTPIRFNASGAPTAGALRITLGGGAEVTASVENGQFVIRSDDAEASYSLAQLRALCS